MQSPRLSKAWLFSVAAAALVLRAAIRRARAADLRGQVVLITGGSRGLGLALARAFAAEGCRLALCARHARDLQQAADDLRARGADVFTRVCDVSDRKQVNALVDAVRERFGRVDVLVNNAGIIHVGPHDAMSLDDYGQAMDVMFWGAVYPTLAVLPDMEARGQGRIVTITSIGGKIGVPHLLPYTCAKFAAVGFSEGLRAELSGRGISVVTIAPGLMRTGSYLNAVFKGREDREPLWFSLGATLPGASISARRAARQIVRAVKLGEAERILTLPANVAALVHGMFPGLTADVLGIVNRWILPGRRAGATARRGADAASLRSPVMQAMTVLGRRAARRLQWGETAGSPGQ